MRQFLLLLFNIGAMASAILSNSTAINTSLQIMQIKSQITKINTHLYSLIDTKSEKYHQLVTISIPTHLLYEYLK